MNYYKRHIGDYVANTAHLSLLEHGVYTRLLDIYYTKESGIPTDQVYRLVGARSQEEREAVDVVLSEFFVLVEGVYRQSRADEEIDAYKAKAERNREVGKLGGRPVNHQEEARNPEITQTVSENNPDITLTTNHKPLTNKNTKRLVDENEKKPRFVAPTVNDIREYCTLRRNNVDPEKFFAHYTSNGWRVGKNKMVDWQAAVRTWERANETNQRFDDRSKARRMFDKLDEIARKDVEKNGFTEFVD